MARPKSPAQALHAFEEIVVFTGDLVGSSKLAPDELARAMREVELASHDIARAWGAVDARFTRYEGKQARGSPDFSPDWEPRFSSFRGDGWQFVGPAPKYALRAALFLRARLGMLGRSFDTRISIGIGSGWLSEQASLNLASGPAFELSGKGLDGVGHVRRFAVAWEGPPGAAPLIRAVFALADEISRNWTPGQARVFAHLLLAGDRPNQTQLARALDITQQSVAEHLAGGGDWAIEEALEAVEE